MRFGIFADPQYRGSHRTKSSSNGMIMGLMPVSLSKDFADRYAMKPEHP